jgi:hypothetical protein
MESNAMKENNNQINRRNFLKTLGTAGIGSVLASTNASAGPNEPNIPAKTPEQKYPQVPKRKLGKTGIEVPCLSIGLMFDTVENQIVLKNAFQWGVNYWDSASGYAGGNSELGIGKFLSKNPDARKNLFIVSKASDAHKNPKSKQAVIDTIEERMQASLKKMNTNYIDMYCGVHGLKDPADLNEDLRKWAENAKKRGLIKFFGFSTHSNMAQCLAAAAKLDWIDIAMTTYNFRLAQDTPMQDAINACNKAGIGLISMKTVALTSQNRKQMESGGSGETASESEKKLFTHFLQKGFTEPQARIKAMLSDERISSVCVGMKNVAILTSNVAAVLDKTKLTQADMTVLHEYALATCNGYCAGCADICDAVLPGIPYVSDIMRYLMYYNSYGEKDMARELFAQIPSDVRGRLLSTDYSLAEARCPQRMPIGRLVAEAVGKLA